MLELGRTDTATCGWCGPEVVLRGGGTAGMEEAELVMNWGLTRNHFDLSIVRVRVHDKIVIPTRPMPIFEPASCKSQMQKLHGQVIKVALHTWLVDVLLKKLFLRLVAHWLLY